MYTSYQSELSQLFIKHFVFLNLEIIISTVVGGAVLKSLDK